MSAARPTGDGSPWRMRAGLALFVLGLVAPVFVPLVTALPFSAELKTVLSGLLVLGVPELLWLIAAALMGKEGFATLKSRLFGWIRELGPPATVGRARYRVGLVLFVLPFLVGLLQPYAEIWLVDAVRHRLVLGVVGDLTLAASLLVLGGDFWDKLRSLFLYDARARLRSQPARG